MSKLVKALENTDFYAVLDYFQEYKDTAAYDFTWNDLDISVMGFTFAEQANADFSKPDKNNMSLMDYAISKNKSDAVALNALNTIPDVIEAQELNQIIKRCIDVDADKFLSKFYDAHEINLSGDDSEILLAESFKLGVESENKFLMDKAVELGADLSTLVTDASGKKVPVAFLVARTPKALPYLFNDGVDLTTKTQDGSNFLHFMAGGISMKSSEVRLINDAVSKAIAAGVDINAKNAAGQPPIYFSVGGGNDDGRALTAIFIKHGAKITDTADPSGITVEGYILEKWGEDAYSEMTAMQIDAMIASSTTSLDDEIEQTPTPRRRRGVML